MKSELKSTSKQRLKPHPQTFVVVVVDVGGGGFSFPNISSTNDQVARDGKVEQRSREKGEKRNKETDSLNYTYDLLSTPNFQPITPLSYKTRYTILATQTQYTHARTHTHTHGCTHTRTHTHTRAHTHTHTHTRTHARTHTHTHTHTRPTPTPCISTTPTSSH